MASPQPKFLVEFVPVEPRYSQSCPLRAVDVSVEVTGLICRYQIRQRYVNEAPEPIEAVVRVPLPDHAAVRSLVVLQGGRVLEAAVKEKEAAKQLYQTAVAQGQRAALAEEARENLMLLRVSQILPLVPVEVRVEIASQVAFEAGEASIVFPTTMTPRYVPAGIPPEDARKISPPFSQGERLYGVSLSVSIDAKVPLHDISSDSHPLVVQQSSPSQAVITLKEGEVLPDRDILLSWKMSTSLETPIIETARLSPEDAATVMISVPPPAETGEEQILPRHVSFLLDVSGSMQGEPIETAKRALRGFLRALGPRDVFSIIAFNTRTNALPALPFNNDSLSRADNFIASLFASGGTEILPALVAAFSFEVSASFVRTVVLLTDGSVSNEDAVVQQISKAASTKGLRAHAIGLGASVNRSLVKRFGKAGRGISEFVPQAADLEPVLARFQARSGAPLATNVSLDTEGAPIVDLTPQALGDLDLGQPLLVFGRALEDGAATIILRGTTFGLPFERRFPLQIPKGVHGNASLPILWAKARIEELTEKDALQNRDEILRIALKHNLLTRFTSLVAVDRTEAGTGEAPKVVEIPLYAPQREQELTGKGAPSIAPFAAPAPSPAPARGGFINYMSRPLQSQPADAGGGARGGADDDVRPSATLLGMPSFAGAPKPPSAPAPMPKALYESNEFRMGNASLSLEVPEIRVKGRMSAPPEPAPAAPAPSQESARPEGGPPRKVGEVHEGTPGGGRGEAAPFARGAAPVAPKPVAPGKSEQERIEAALRFLARAQSASGSFGEDPVLTALVVAAFALAGETPKKGLYRRQLARAEAFLQQNPPTPAVPHPMPPREQLLQAQHFGGDNDGGVIGIGSPLLMTALLVRLLLSR